MVEYKINTASAEEIMAFLKERDGDFVPVLSSRVNPDEYAVKLKNNAVNFEAWDSGKLLGVVSVYMNNFDTMQAFIPMVCVAPELRGKGVARRLMHDFINAAYAKGFFESKLEVDKNNVYAIALYESLGYKLESQEGNSYFMVRKGQEDEQKNA